MAPARIWEGGEEEEEEKACGSEAEEEGRVRVADLGFLTGEDRV